MHVVVIGCGRTGSALAVRLAAEGDDVAVVDADPAAGARLPDGFAGRFVVGNGGARAVLEEAGTSRAESLVAVTSDDSVNAVAARVGRDVFRVPRVVAMLNDPAHGILYRELGIVTVGPADSTVNRVVRLLHHAALAPHQAFGNGETVLVRSVVPDYLQGRPAFDLNVPGEIQVVELTRGGRSRIPDPSTRLAKGDLVTFVAVSASLGRLESFLGGRWSA